MNEVKSKYDAMLVQKEQKLKNGSILTVMGDKMMNTKWHDFKYDGFAKIDKIFMDD